MSGGDPRDSLDAILASKLSMRPASDYFLGLSCRTVSGIESCVISWEFIVDQLWWTAVIWAGMIVLTLSLRLLKNAGLWCWRNCMEKRLKTAASVDDDEGDDDDSSELGTWSARAAAGCPGLAATANFFTQIAPSVYISISFTLRMAAQEYPQDLLLVDTIVHCLFALNLLARLTWYPLGNLTPMWQIATIIDIANLVSFAVLLTSECRWPVVDGSFVPGERCVSSQAAGASVPAHTWFDFSFMRAAYTSDLLNVVATAIALFNELLTQLTVFLTSDDLLRDSMPATQTHEVFAQPMFPLSPRARTTDSQASVKPRTRRSRVQKAVITATVTTSRAVRRCCPNTDGFCWRLTKFSLSALSGLFICSVLVYVLEVVGEAPWLRDIGSSVLWRQYACDDGSISNQQSDTCADEALSPFVAFYFVLISLSTVGYGDFSPSTVVSRLFVLVIIILGVIAFGNAASTLLELLQSRQRPWESLSYVPSRMGNHVAVLGAPGSVSSGQLLTFLSELFASDVDGTVDELALFRCVVMCPETGISAALRRQLVTGRCSWFGTWIKEGMLLKGLEDAEASGSERQVSSVDDLALEHTSLPLKSDGAVVYLQGDPNDDTQLRRAAVGMAQCVFIVSDATAASAEGADQYAMQLALRCMLLLRDSVLDQEEGEPGKLRVLLRLPTSVAQAISLGIPADGIVCSDQCDSSLAVYNAVAPGASAAIGSLLVSTEPSIQKCATPSQLEYAMGAGNEVYSCIVPAHKGFHEHSWTKVVAAVYFLSSKKARKGRRRVVRTAGSHEVSMVDTCSAMCSGTKVEQPHHAAQDVDRLLDLYSANCGIHLIGFKPPGGGRFTLGMESTQVCLPPGSRVFGIAQDQAAMDRLASMDLASYFAASGEASLALANAEGVPADERGIELTSMDNASAASAALEQAAPVAPSRSRSTTRKLSVATNVPPHTAPQREKDDPLQYFRHSTARAIFKHAISQQHKPGAPPGALLVRGGHVVVMSTSALPLSVAAHMIQLLRSPGQCLSASPIVFMLPAGSDGFNPFARMGGVGGGSTSIFRNVHVLQGCCFDQLDLLRAGCMTAKRIILLGSGDAGSTVGSQHGSHSHSLLSASALWTLLGSYAKVTMLFSSNDTASLLPSILLASTIAPRFPRIRRQGASQSRYVQMRLATTGHALKQLWYAVDKLQGAQQAALNTHRLGDEQARAALALTGHLKSAELAVQAGGQRVTSGVATSLIAGSWAKPHILTVARSLLGFASPGFGEAAAGSSSCVLQSIPLSKAMMQVCAEEGYADWPPYWRVHQYCLQRLGVLPVGIIRNCTSAFHGQPEHNKSLRTLSAANSSAAMASSREVLRRSSSFTQNSPEGGSPEGGSPEEPMPAASSSPGLEGEVVKAPQLVQASNQVLKAAGGMFSRDGCVVLSPIADSLVTDSDAVLCFACADSGPLGQIVRLQRSLRRRLRRKRVQAKQARKGAPYSQGQAADVVLPRRRAPGILGS